MKRYNKNLIAANYQQHVGQLFAVNCTVFLYDKCCRINEPIVVVLLCIDTLHKFYDELKSCDKHTAYLAPDYLQSTSYAVAMLLLFSDGVKRWTSVQANSAGLIDGFQLLSEIK